MGNAMKFDYYYGVEAEQFSFYRVPRLLIKDERFKGLSSDAKLLYGLMLDRMAMSMKNGWLDDENRAYIIYSVANVAEDLGCSKPTCTKIMKELDSDHGIGLIEKKRRGLGKPDIIYVKNFASLPEKGSTNFSVPAEIKNSDFQKQKTLTSRSQDIEFQEMKQTEFRGERNLSSRNKKAGSQEVKEFVPNYNNTNYNKQNHINLTDQLEQRANDSNEWEENDRVDAMDHVDSYMAMIRNNLEYDRYMGQKRHDNRELFEEIYETVCDIVCVKRSTIRINGELYPYELVKSRFLKLNSGHVEYVMGCMKDTTTKITNIRSYLITALYNAPSTMGHYYQQEVQHDMYGGGWQEKGIK